MGVQNEKVGIYLVVFVFIRTFQIMLSRFNLGILIFKVLHSFLKLIPKGSGPNLRN